MNPDSPKTPREEMETWLTSLLLGELSAGEAAAVRELIKHDPELTKLHEELKATIHLVREAAVKTTEPTPIAQDQPKLSTERRKKLLAQFKTIKLAEPNPRKRRIRLVELAAVLVLIAAIVGLLAAISAPSLRSFRSKGYSQMSAIAPEGALLERPASTPAAPPPPAAVVVFDGADPKLKDSYFNQLGSAQVENSTVYYGISPQSGGDNFAADSPAKKPVGLTSVPASRATPIVLPALPNTDSPSQAERNYTVTASVGGRADLNGTVQTSGQPGTWIGGTPVKPDQPQNADNKFVYRYAAATPMPSLGGTQAPAQQPREPVVDPSTGLPATAEPALVVDPSTGLPVAAAVTGDATTELETRTFPVNSEALHQALGTTPAPDEAFRRRYSPNSGLLTIPRVSVAGGGGGGGGGGATPTEPSFTPPAVSETAPNSAGYLSGAAGVNLKTDEGKSVSLGGGGVQTRGITLDGMDKSDTNRARTPVETPVVDSYYLPLSKAEPLPTVTATNSLSLTDQQEFASGQSRFGSYAGKPQVAGGALILGRTFTNSTDANGQLGYEVAAAESLDRPAKERGRVEELRDLTKPDLKRTLAEFSDDSGLRETSLGLKVAEDRLAALQTDSVVSATDVEQAQKQVTDLKKKAELANADANNAQVYLRKKRELEDMVDFQRLLTRKMNIEAIDEHLPKSAQVEIIERATAVTPTEPSLWGRLSGKSAPQAAAAAQIKIDRDKSDIEDLTAPSAKSANVYDPYFIQTETEVIKSDAVLGGALNLLQADTNVAVGSIPHQPTAAAVASLRQQLEVKPVANTSLIEIRANAGAPEEAVRVANAVTEAYRQWRLDKGLELVRGGLKSLEERAREQEQMIRKAKVELAQLGESLGISDDTSSSASETGKNVKADLAIRKPSTNAPIPQPEIQTSENNFSTFSLNVSDVSFKLAAASLEKGQMPDAASVRSEEFINAFDYRDPEPAAGAPIAFTWERARYPFAHNRDLLRFSLKTAAAGRQAGRALNIVLLLDNSGSMERADRVRIIREALRVLAGQLQPQDKLSVITFARTPRLVADGISGDKAGEVAESVSGLTPEGGTNLEEAMNLAYQTVLRHYLAAGINRVVLLTDGAANLGNVEPESLKQKVEAHRKQGIALDCFGIGWEGYNDDLLEVLSRNGDGRYGFLNSPEAAASEFAGQLAGALKVAASDVKVQVEFNPRRVTSYRQIGYAKHQLTKEQFRDNTVDAAEIAAQEAGNALYTVEVNPAGDGPLCTVRVRYKIPGTSDYREQAWDVPFTGNALSLEQSSPAMRLAGSAAAFSEWLVASPFAGEVSPDGVLNVLRGVPEAFGADSRPRTLEWMIRQAKSLEGK